MAAGRQHGVGLPVVFDVDTGTDDAGALLFGATSPEIELVAALATWGNTTLKADGLGAYIASVTRTGETPLIIASIAVMSLFVVLMNKFIWRRLYAFAERRFRLD